MTCIYPGSQITYFYRTLPTVFESSALWMMLECVYLCAHKHNSKWHSHICSAGRNYAADLPTRLKKVLMFLCSCCIGAYSPFFTFFEDFSYFIKRNIILVRYLEQKKAMISEARRLLSLSLTPYFTERNNNNKKPGNEDSCSAL